VDLVMQKDGLSASDVNIIMVAPADMVAAFASKNIDAGWNAEPQATIAVQQGVAVETAVTGDLFPGAVGATLALSPGFAQSQPEAAQRFVYATLRGHEDFYHAFISKDVDKTPIVQILVNHTPIKDPRLYDVIGLASVDRVPTMDTASWDVLQAYFLKITLQKNRVDLTKFVDNSYIQAAAQRLGIQ
jgi:NitT/TauT family transport system substrate-binding protein